MLVLLMRWRRSGRQALLVETSLSDSFTGGRVYRPCSQLVPSSHPDLIPVVGSLPPLISSGAEIELAIRGAHEGTLFFFSFFFSIFGITFYFPASGQAVVSGVIPSPPRYVPSIFIAHRVQRSHCSSIFIGSC